MKINLSDKRHKLLELLGNRLVDADVNGETTLALGIRYDEIMKHLECNNLEMRLVISKLIEEKEIDKFELGFPGFFCTEKGLSSFLDKKYLREECKRKREEAKDWVQIAVPILALLISIAILIVTETKLKSMKTDIQELKTDIKILKGNPKSPK